MNYLIELKSGVGAILAKLKVMAILLVLKQIKKGAKRRSFIVKSN